jgi:HPt (histidine-containing phosphotransfer) domain-containing protein
MSLDQHTIFATDAPTRRLLERYLQRRRDEIALLQRALECGDYEQIRRIGHNLHGSGAAFDIHRISAIGARLELAAERADSAAIGRNIEELSRFLAHIAVDPT